MWGLIRYSLKTGQLDIFKHDSADPQSLSHNKVYYLMLDKNGMMWIGTFGGLNQMIPGTEKDKPRFIHWRSTNSDLPIDNIYSIIDGGDGTLWMSCGNKVSHFFPQTGIFRNYHYYDGLHGQGLNKGLRSHNGEIYFSSKDGLIVFHPDSLQSNPYTPPVAITGISIHNEPVSVQGNYGDTLQWETPLAHTMPYTDAVEFTYKQNDFSLEFAALNFVNPENNLYKYKLEPYEPAWIETTAGNRIARYTNISPGKYTFRVIGSNNDGLWNEEGRSLSIIIHPPWWQTWWAYTLYALLALGTILSIRHYEMKRLKLRQRAAYLSELDHLKSRFFANISHEFRTPLTLILGPLQNFISRTSEENEDKPIYQMMQRNAKRLLQLVNQLLDLSKLEAGSIKLEPKPADIISFLKATVLSFTSLAEKKQIQYHVQFPREHPVVYFDADKLEKIIINLISNAFKFTPTGREVSVTALMSPAEKRYIPASFSKAGSSSKVNLLELKVQDSGKGIAEELREKIFDRFYQIDTSYTKDQEGTGIGLSLVKELVELHEGEVSVESQPEKGSCFTVRLPLIVADFEQLKVGEHALQHGQSTIATIIMAEDEINAVSEPVLPQAGTNFPLVLIVEDNADIRAFIRQHLDRFYQTIEACDGAAGYSKAVEMIPDLILSDVMMPEIDGVELCRKLKTNEKTAHVPVILLTAKASGADKIEGLETGADDYIIKPFEAAELQVRIKNLIDSRKRLREQFSREITLEPASITITSVDEQFLQRVMQVLEPHMADAAFSVEALGLEVGMSRTQLFRKFKALTNHTPGDFIRLMRLKRAAKLLSHGAGNIAEVAFLVGFQEPSYFTKCFQKQFGQTPSEYLKSPFY